MMAFVVRRGRWMALGWVAKRVGRSRIESSVDRATAKIEDKLPTPVANVVKRLPGDVARAGGTVVVAGQSARTASAAARSLAQGGRRVVSASAFQLRDRRTPARVVSDNVQDLRDEIAIESDEASRRIRSEMLRATHGDDAALDALLDLRPVDDGPLPTMPDSINRGRHRFRPALPESPVNRMRRTYRQPTKPWDRPPRRR